MMKIQILVNDENKNLSSTVEKKSKPTSIEKSILEKLNKIDVWKKYKI